MIDLLKQHRTIRKYSDKNIDSQLLENLLETACRASNTGNMQAYSIVVTTENDIKKQLAPAHFNQPMVMQAPVILTFCCDFRRITTWCKLRDAQPGFDNFQSFIAGFIDAIIVAQTFSIAAESVGLGICYLGTTTYNADKIIQTLNLPELVVPVTTLTVGYPSETPEITDRLPQNAITHYQKYTDYSESEINDCYMEKENNPFYKQFVTENNKSSLAQVFTDIRYLASNNVLFSEKFLEVLKMQGFL